MKRTKKKQVKVSKKRFEYRLQYQKNNELIVESFDSLNDVRKFGCQEALALETTHVYRVDPSTKKSVKLSKPKYLFLNKLYNASKSIDGTGFYHEWAWEKKSPFKQVGEPLPKSFTEPTPPVIVESAMPVKKTFWQKVKQYILNMFE